MDDLERLHELELSKQRYSYPEHRRPKKSNLDTFYVISVLPMVILTYLQVIFNIIVSVIVLWSFVSFIKVILTDLDKHVNEKSYLLMGEMIQCSKEYMKNNCQNNNIPPAIEKYCDQWKMCMNQDIRNISKTKETAVVLAQILNNFFDNLTDRTIYCIGGVLVGGIIFMNGILSWTRYSKTHEKVH